MALDEQRRVVSFIEKPAPSALAAVNQSTVLASMGIYVFSTHYLAEAFASGRRECAAHRRFRPRHPPGCRAGRPGAGPLVRE